MASGITLENGAGTWSPPEPGMIKLNVDGAIFDSLEKFGFSLIARDHNDLLIEGQAKLLQGLAQPKLAEAIGIREALSWIKRNPWKKAIVESDCLVAVQAIRSSQIMLSVFGDVINECKALVKDVPLVKVLFVL